MLDLKVLHGNTLGYIDTKGYPCAAGGSDVPLLALKRATAKRGALLDAEVAAAITGESQLRRTPTAGG